MIKLTTQTVIVLLTATFLPPTLSLKYPVYNSYQRASRAGNYQYDRAQPTYYNGYRDSYDQNEPGNYYVDERNDQTADREYYYGKPTYHGEYKPTRYYYAKEPNYNYNYNDDHMVSENPLDYLHEEMLQEDQRDRQHHMPVGQPQWFQNTGQPKSLTNNFIKNLMLYNDGYNPIERQPESSLSNGYNNNGYINNDNNDDIDEMYDSLPYDFGLKNEYANAPSLSGQHTKHTLSDEPNQPYDYYDSLLENRPSHLTSSASQKQNDYFGKGNPDEYNYGLNKEPTYSDYEESPKVDKDVQDLKSLRKHHLRTWDSSDNEKFDPFAANIKLSPLKLHNTFSSSSNSGYEAGHKDYDGEEDGPWINWDRKRSLKDQQNNEFGPLKELEYRLTSLQKHANELNKLKVSTTTTTTTSAPSTTTLISRLSNNKMYEHKGQKEIFLSRPATPVRHYFSDSVLDALVKSNSDSKPSLKTASTYSEQQNSDGTDKIKTAHQNWSGTKKMKRFVSNEASLVQQLNGLKGKIRA